MYGNDKLPKIHAIHSNEAECESESVINKPEWCPKSEKEISQTLWVNAISRDLEEVAAIDPRPHGSRSAPEKPKWFYCHASQKWVDLKMASRLAVQTLFSMKIQKKIVSC